MVRGRARDNQKSKVTTLTNSHYPSKFERTMSLAECEAMIAKAYAVYGLRWSGRVKDGRGTRTAYGAFNYASLPVWARHPKVVLHEAAHGIMQRLGFPDATASHGPEFVRVMIELWARFKIQPMADIRAEARTLKIRVSTDARAIPPTLSKPVRVAAHKRGV